MAEMSPENIQKLIQRQVRTQTAATADGIAGLSAGDKMELMSGFEKIVNAALSGNARMGGREGLIQKLDTLIEGYSKSIKDEMSSMFNKIFKKSEEKDKDDEPVKIDEKQYKELHEDSLKKTFNSDIMKNLQTQRSTELKKFLKGNFINSVLNNKMFKGLINKVSGIANTVGRLSTTFLDIIVPGLGKLVSTVTRGFAMISSRLLLLTWTFITTIATAIFTFVSFIFTTVIPAIVGGVLSIITFLAPIAATVAVIALKVLLIVGVVFLIVFAIWKVWSWLNNNFPEAIQKVKDFFSMVWENTKKLWDGFIDSAKMFWGWLKESAVAAWEAAGVAWDWLNTNIGNLVTWVSDMFLHTWDWLKDVPIIGSVFTWIEGTLMDVVSNLHTLFFGNGPFMDRLVNFFLDTKLFQDLASVGTWILDTFRNAWDTLYGWVKSIYDWTGGAIDSVKDTVIGAAEKTWEGTKAVGNALNPLNWFADGGIVEQPTLAVIGEKLGTSEAVIPLDSRGINFLSKAITDANVIGGDSFFMNLALTEIETLKNTFDIKNALGELYKFATAEEFNYSNLTTSANNIDPKQWLADGGIVLKENIVGVGEDGPEMVVPLNASGAEFVRSILQDDIYSSDGNDFKVGDLDKKMSAMMKMMKSGRNQNGTPINTSKTSQTANYVDMIAKGIIG